MLKGKFTKLRKAVRLQINRLLAYILGEDVLTLEERSELTDSGKMPETSLRFVERSFVLGRLSAILKSKEYKGITYSELIDEANSVEFSELETATIDQLKVNTAKHFKAITDDVETAVFDEVQKAEKDAISTASVSGESLSDIRWKNQQKMLDSLVGTINKSFKKKFKLLTETEFHAAKTQGISQAIVNKVDVYSGTHGADSNVSVIPKSDACVDCKKQYLDASGDPKIFKLSSLISAGTNADKGVTHEKRQGVHVNWKATLPPLHPRCRCVLQYIPEGATWRDGRLVLSDAAEFTKSVVIAKAIGDSKLSATQKPQGAPSNSPSPGQANIPGAKGSASPDKPATGPDAGGKQKSSWAGMDVEYVPKSEASDEQKGRQIGATESSIVIPKGSGKGGALTPEEENQLGRKQAEQFNRQPHPHDVVLDHLSNGEFAEVNTLNSELNAQQSYKVRIEGNGSALMKPTQEYDHAKLARGLIDVGATTAQHGTGHKREEAAYKMYAAFGMSDHCPPTATRKAELPDGTSKEVSMQRWNEDSKNLLTHLLATTPEGQRGSSAISLLLKKAPVDKHDHLMKKISEISVMNVVMNHNDGHRNNIMVTEDFSDITAIDHANTFGNGMDSLNNGLHMDLHNSGRKLQVPDHMMEKFSKTTFEDLQRTLGDNVSDWEAGQTFLRMKYVEHLQKTEGHLDYNKFRTVITSIQPDPKAWKSQTGKDAFMSRVGAGTDPRSLFSSFSKKWIEDNKGGKIKGAFNSNTATANKLDKIGVFMPADENAYKDVKAYRKTGKHKNIADSIKPGLPEKLLPAGSTPGGANTESLDSLASAVGLPSASERKQALGDDDATPKGVPQALGGDDDATPKGAAPLPPMHPKAAASETEEVSSSQKVDKKAGEAKDVEELDLSEGDEDKTVRRTKKKDGEVPPLHPKFKKGIPLYVRIP